MLTYGDFYEQLKSTGFGDFRLAAQFLVRRFRFSFSEENFSRFVTVVKVVRDEILEKNPNNKYVGRHRERKNLCRFCSRYIIIDN